MSKEHSKFSAAFSAMSCKEELRKLSDEEASKAFEEASPIPMSPEEIESIVQYVLNKESAERETVPLTNRPTLDSIPQNQDFACLNRNRESDPEAEERLKKLREKLLKN